MGSSRVVIWDGVRSWDGKWLEDKGWMDDCSFFVFSKGKGGGGGKEGNWIKMQMQMQIEWDWARVWIILQKLEGELQRLGEGEGLMFERGKARGGCWC